MEGSFYKEYDRFFEMAKASAKTHPFLVVQTFYDLSVASRNEYPVKRGCAEIANDLKDKVGRYIALLENGSRMYPSGAETALRLSQKGQEDVKDRTGNVYGPLWRQFDFKRQFDYARKAIIERIQNNGFDLNRLKGKKVIDIGCGSGRFACALASFGPAETMAYDWGESGLKTGEAMAKELNIKNIRFEKGSILDIPYGDESFDFCFANGVFHHTEDLWKGLGEQFRLMKTGGAGWLYLYGDGGFFWYSRKKMREVISLQAM